MIKIGSNNAAANAGLITSDINGTVMPPIVPAKPDLEIPVISTAKVMTRRLSVDVNSGINAILS